MENKDKYAVALKEYLQKMTVGGIILISCIIGLMAVLVSTNLERKRLIAMVQERDTVIRLNQQGDSILTMEQRKLNDLLHSAYSKKEFYVGGDTVSLVELVLFANEYKISNNRLTFENELQRDSIDFLLGYIRAYKTYIESSKENTTDLFKQYLRSDSLYRDAYKKYATCANNDTMAVMSNILRKLNESYNMSVSINRSDSIITTTYVYKGAVIKDTQNTTPKPKKKKP